MAVKKKTSPEKKAPVKKAARKKAAAPASQQVKILVEIIVKNQTADAVKATPVPAAAEMNLIPAFAAVEDGPKPNFKFAFTMPEGVRLSRIDIDGFIFDREKLENAAKIDNGKLVVELFARVMTTPIPMIIDAVGEPDFVMTFTLKFDDADVFKDDDPQKIKIGSNRRGRLELEEVNLP